MHQAAIRDPKVLKLTLSVLGTESKRGLFSGLDGTELRLALPKVTIEYLQAVLLRAYRDGMAEIGHVHIETNAADLTLLFSVSAPPMSADEAMRLLEED